MKSIRSNMLLGLALVALMSLPGENLRGSEAGNVSGSAATYRMQRKQYDRNLEDQTKARKAYIEEGRATPEYKEAQKRVLETNRAFKAKVDEVIEQEKKANPDFNAVTIKLEGVDKRIEMQREAGGDPKEFQKLYQEKADLKKQARKEGMVAFVKQDGDVLYKEGRDASVYLQDMDLTLRQKAGHTDEVKALEQQQREIREQMDSTLVELAVARSELREARRQEENDDMYYNGGGGWWRGY